MEGDEIMKHTKKSYAILRSTDNNWKHKLGEIVNRDKGTTTRISKYNFQY
jgi:hypothetical protein